MSRAIRPLLLFSTLVTGVLLGMLLERGGPRVSAQAAKTVRGEAVPASNPAATAPQPKARSEEDLYQQLDRQYELFHHVNRTFELVAKAVSPAVVHIVAHKTSRNEETGRVRHFEETGSGVIVRGSQGRELYVLTNNHVVDGAPPAKINIVLHDGRALHPDRYWLDPKADIAVLNLGRDDLPVARLGDSEEARVGTWVLALGSPFGLTHSVSQGIISARGRHMEELQDVENQDFLQTDAAINPGNSGGPLVNMKGEIIGINNSIASNGGGNEGVGFSIPINLARWIMNQLIANGRVSRGALGVDLHPEFRPEDAVAMGLDRPKGAWVDVVHEASPAFAAGLHDGDVILRFRGVEIHDLNHLINMVSMAPIGQPAEVVVWRKREQLVLSVTVGNRDRAVAAAGTPVPTSGTVAERTNPKGLLRRLDRPDTQTLFARGLELVTLDAASLQRLGLPANLRGAAVTRVAPDSPLASFFQPLDVIASVDGQLIASAEEAARALNRREANATVVLVLDRLVKGAVERKTVRVPR
jgi:serine protease Do